MMTMMMMIMMIIMVILKAFLFFFSFFFSFFFFFSFLVFLFKLDNLIKLYFKLILFWSDRQVIVYLSESLANPLQLAIDIEFLSFVTILLLPQVKLALMARTIFDL